MSHVLYKSIICSSNQKIKSNKNVERENNKLIKAPNNYTIERDYHAKKMNNFLMYKYTKQRELDLRLMKVFKHCNDDCESLICKILWRDTYDCLKEINEINKQTNFDQFYNDFINDKDYTQDIVEDV